MSTQHPIAPPEELLEQWYWTGKSGNWQYALTLAYRAGADQELEACCEWLDKSTVGMAELLRAARRPKPLSLKEQALSLVPEPGGIPMNRFYSPDELLTIRKALEQLND